MNNSRSFGKMRNTPRYAVGQVSSRTNKQVALGYGVVGIFRTMHAHVPQVQGVCARKSSFTHERAYHGNLHGVHQRHQGFACVCTYHAATRNYERFACFANKHGSLAHLLRIALYRGFIARDVYGFRPSKFKFLPCNVAWHVYKHRAWAPRACHMEGFSKSFRELVGFTQQIGMLHHGQRDAKNISLLERIGPDNRGGHLGRYYHQRHAVHIGCCNARDRVGGTRAAGHQHYARFTGCTRVTVGFMHRRLFMPG